jgi:hypothetical protein
MLRDNIISFCLLLILPGVVFAQASSQREVRITNPTNSNYISLLSPSGVNAPPSTYSLILPTALPSGVSLLYTTASGALNWTPSPTTDGQVLIISGGAPAWSNGTFMQYDVTLTQSTSNNRTNNLFNVSYNSSAPNANAAGGIITSTGGGANASATGLTITANATGSGTATGLSVAATGGTTNSALNATGNINILSSGGNASSLSLYNPAGTFASTIKSGAQLAAITYTLPTTAPLASSVLYSSGGASSTLSWSNTGSNGQVLTMNGGIPSWQTPAASGNFVNYDVTSSQSTAAARTDNLFNIAYSPAAAGGPAAGAVITSSVGAGSNSSASGLTLSSTASGTGTATGLAVSASGGATNTAIAATGNVNLLSSGGTASTLGLQNPAATFSTNFTAGAQMANINYTLPVSSPAAGSLLYSSGGASSTLTWSPAGTNGQFLTLSSGVPAWGNAVNYDVTTAQNTITDRTHNLFNVAYSGAASDASSAGAVITSVAGPTNGTATGLTITATGTGLGNSTGLSVTANGGTTNTAIAATGNVNILSAAGSANTLGLQNPAGTFTSYFKAGAQSTDITYTLPTSAPVSNGLVLTANTSGVLSWASAGSSSGGWLTGGNSSLVDNTNNYLGTLDNIPVRFVSGSGGPNTRMVLDINGNLLFGSGSGTTTVSSGSGKLAFGDALTTARLNSVPTIGTNVFNMIDASAALRVWRFATNAGNSDPAIDLIGGTNDNQANSANQWWTMSSTGTPGNATSGTNGTGEHLTFRRRSGSTDSEYVSIFAGGNVGIGANSSGYIPSPSSKLTVMTVDAATTTTTDVVSIGHNSTATPSTSYGTGLVFKGQSSTTADRNIAKVGAVWTNATDASRNGALTFTTDSVGTDREKMRILANGYVGFNATDPGIRADINGGYATRSKTVTLTNGRNDNVSVGDCAFLRIIGPTTGFTITGLDSGVDGQRLRVANITGQDMTIADSSSFSYRANQIETNTNSDIVVKGPVPILDMTYDKATRQWLLGTLNANQIIGGIGSIIYAYKTGDETISNNTVQDDDNLAFTVAANQTWEINGELDFRCTSTNPDIQMGFTIPGGTMKVMYTGIQDAGGNAIMGNGQMTASGTYYFCGSDNTNAVLVSLRGIIRTTAAGTIQFRWAQNTTSGGNPLTLKTDSYMKLIRIQ